MMKKLKILGVLLVSLFLPMLVNAETCNEDCIAKIGDVKYATLQDAVDAAPNGIETNIEILKGGTNIPGFKLQSGKNIIVDFNGYTIQLGEPLVGSPGTVTQNFQLLKDSTVVLKNGTLKGASVAKRLIQNYANLTLKDMTLDGRTLSEETEYAVSFNNGKVNILGNTSIYAKNDLSFAFDVYYWPINKGLPAYPNGTQVYIDTTGTIKGMIEVSGTTNVNPTSTLQIKNINHEGELSIDTGFEKQVSIKGGTYTTNIENLLDKTTQKQVHSNGKYTIYNLYDVLVGKLPENGKISFDKEHAYYGDTINMTITPDEGYELDTIKVIDFYNNEIKVENNKFTMPNSEVWVSVKFKAIQKVVTPVISEKIEVGIQDTGAAQDVLLESLSKDEKFKDENVNVQLVVDDIKATEEITKEFTKSLENNKVNDGKIVSYFDISIAIKDAKTNETLGNLTELTKKIQFAVSIPENVENVKDGYTRNYYIIKKHNDKVSVINGILSKDGKYVIFETDEFSTYALAYEDKEINNVENPQTSDGIISALVFGGLALVGIAGITLYFKKELENK